MKKQKIIEKLHLLTDARVLGLIAFGLIAVLVTWSSIKVVQINYDLEKKISIARQRNAVEQLENENLKLKNKYYESNQFLELAARRQFGKAAAGEKLYVVPENVALSKTIDLPKQQQTSLGPETKSKSRQNFDAWMKFLFR